MQENGILRALNFKFSWGSMPPNPPSSVGANHSCQILDPPLIHTNNFKCEAALSCTVTHLQKNELKIQFQPDS